jgi:sulfatase maturation enzyme AslB (radical SAM superfamily)
LILKNNASDKAIIKAFDDETSFFATWVKNIQQYKEIYFAGGEPLVTEAHYKMLNLLLENEKNNIPLKYNTNLSILNFKHFDLLNLWKQFNNLTLDISIDHIEEKGEYIRKGLNWSVFLKNFNTLKKEFPNVNIKITPTISIFNILDIGLIHKYFVDHKLIEINEFELNILDRPNFYNIQSLPPELKKEAEENLEKHIDFLMNNEASEMSIKSFQTLKNYLLNENQSSKGFERYNNKLDQLRYEDFKTSFPKLLNFRLT